MHPCWKVLQRVALFSASQIRTYFCCIDLIMLGYEIVDNLSFLPYIEKNRCDCDLVMLSIISNICNFNSTLFLLEQICEHFVGEGCQ